MDKFTKIQKKESTEQEKSKDVLFENDWLKIKEDIILAYLKTQLMIVS